MTEPTKEQIEAGAEVSSDWLDYLRLEREFHRDLVRAINRAMEAAKPKPLEEAKARLERAAE